MNVATASDDIDSWRSPPYPPAVLRNARVAGKGKGKARPDGIKSQQTQ